MNMYTGTRDEKTGEVRIEVMHVPTGEICRIICNYDLDWSTKDGSARIARAILELEFGKSTGALCSNDFRCEVVAKQPHNCLIISGLDIRAWFEDYQRRGQEYEEWLARCAAESKPALAEVQSAA